MKAVAHLSEPLRPGRPGRFRMTPNHMSRQEITREQMEALHRVAIDVFTDMSNNGFSFQEALAAVYMTGVENTLATLRDQSST